MLLENLKRSKPIKIVVVGHVDDGKSTLIGRLLYETKMLSPQKIAEVKAVSAKRNMPTEWSFVLDAFQAERDQAITIDTCQIYLKTSLRDVVIVDAPGHIEFLKNMVSGAADADAAILLVDGSEGIREQTRRHAYLLYFLGIKQVAIIVNKMDLINFSESTFKQVAITVNSFLNDVGIYPNATIPVSARYGDALISHSKKMPWYQGPTLLECIHNFSFYDDSTSLSLRCPIQDIYKFDAHRVIVGKIESGTINVGDELLFSPTNQTAIVRSIESWNTTQKSTAIAGESIGITIDKPLFVQRGDIISHVENSPILTNIFKATIFWFGKNVLEQGKSYRMRICTRELVVTVKAIEYEINVNSLQKNKVLSLAKNQCGEITLSMTELTPLDEYNNFRNTGRFILIDDNDIVAGGMISMKGYYDQREHFIGKSSNLSIELHHITRERREKRNGHKCGILWFTGLSGAGKSTLAMAVEKILFLDGYQVYVLDGDNIRAGLNADLNFSPKNRTENIRRIGEVATLFANSGTICITSFISPYQKDRDAVREKNTNIFHEIYIKASLEACEKRDPKNLYKKARAGEILQFTGISSSYEEPNEPELIVDTEKFSINECANAIVKYIKQNFL